MSVALPSRDVAETVGPIVTAIREAWTGALPLVDQVLVIDSASTDATAAVAEAAGAQVVVAPEPGKGEALQASLDAVDGDLVVWLDADVAPFDPAFVPGLLGPLLHLPAVQYVKGFYRRDLHGRPDDGGRVTEICARPLINLLYPDLAGFVQPLAGEAAGRTEALRRIPLAGGYAVELALLIDLWERHGLGALAQVDLGRRAHRHQTTRALGRMAQEITRSVLERVVREGRAPPGLVGPAPPAIVNSPGGSS